MVFDKVTARIAKLCYGLDMKYVDPAEIAQKVHLVGCSTMLTCPR